jgi:hypothetical protein
MSDLGFAFNIHYNTKNEMEFYAKRPFLQSYGEGKM